jgi:hypothetical protein
VTRCDCVSSLKLVILSPIDILRSFECSVAQTQSVTKQAFLAFFILSMSVNSYESASTA